MYTKNLFSFSSQEIIDYFDERLKNGNAKHHLQTFYYNIGYDDDLKACGKDSQGI